MLFKNKNFSCKQIVPTTTFKSNATLKTDISSAKLQEQLYHILIRISKVSDTICSEIRNKIQQLQKRCTKEGQFTSFKLF